MATVLFVFNVLTRQNKSWLPHVRPQLFFEIGLAPDMPAPGNPWLRRLIGGGRGGGREASLAACVLLPSPEAPGLLPHIRAVASPWLCICRPAPHLPTPGS